MQIQCESWVAELVESYRLMENTYCVFAAETTFTEIGGIMQIIVNKETNVL